MTLKDSFPHPAVHLNQYLWTSLKTLDATLEDQYGTIVPFFPLADSRAGDAGWGNKPYVVYDTLFKFRTKPFYVVKKVHVAYFIRGQADDVLAWTNAMFSILDRGDAAGQDVNSYLASLTTTPEIFYHDLRVVQIDQTNEQRMDLSARQYYTQTMIVEINYHQTAPGIFN